jgi:uncharacterized protein (DUF305 family)
VVADLTSRPSRTQEKTMKRAAGVLVAAAVLALAGCGSPVPTRGTGTPGPAATTGAGAPAATTTAEYTAADVMFAQMMVTQEKETADLIDLTKTKSVSAPTRTLTAAIRATQADEAQRLITWLKERKQPTKADSDPAAHTQHGGNTALTAADFRHLRRAQGKDFERELLNVLLGRQHNAVELARTTAAANGDPWVKAVAQQVDRSRTAEVAEILKMVAAL